VMYHLLMPQIDVGGRKSTMPGHRYVSGPPDRALANDAEVASETVVDQVFCLSVRQLAEFVYGNRELLGEDYYLAKDTEAAILQNGQTAPELDANFAWSYWLNTPATAYSYYVRQVSTTGDVNGAKAHFGTVGVRPALYLNLSVGYLHMGTGSFDDPLRFHSFAENYLSLCDFKLALYILEYN
jgi:hypothetical protein